MISKHLCVHVDDCQPLIKMAEYFPWKWTGQRNVEMIRYNVIDSSVYVQLTGILRSIPLDLKDWRGSSQRHHGARLKVKVNYSMCDSADAAARGTCSHLPLLKALEITLKGKQEDDTLFLLWQFTVNLDIFYHPAIRENWKHLLSELENMKAEWTDRCQDVPSIAFQDWRPALTVWLRSSPWLSISVLLGIFLLFFLWSWEASKETRKGRKTREMVSKQHYRRRF